VSLLNDYLHAVRTFLPRGVDHTDILNELSAHLEGTLEEREEELGRSLTTDEQAAVLSNYGSPLVVAARYGSTNHGLSFGRQLIGPEVFVIYRLVLAAQFTITLLAVTAVRMFGGLQGNILLRYLGPMALQLVLTTVIFIAIDAFKQRSDSRSPWNFPPHYMRPIPRWQSLSGLITLSVFALWWGLIPYAPFLLLGTYAGQVQFTASWHAFYWPILIPLLIGVTQRLVTFIEPKWSWVQAATRLVTNGWGVVLVYPFLRAYPYLEPFAASAQPIATGVSNALWWNAIATCGLYWLINAAFAGVMSVQHLSHYLRRRREQVTLQHTTSPW
jgi:hypothetical protein